MSLRPKLLIGVAGGSGSGKSTFCERLAKSLGGNITTLACDHYYRCLAHEAEPVRAATNFDHPDSIDFEHLVDHVRMLAAGQSINRPEYCFATHTRKEATVSVEPSEVVLVEGILLFCNEPLRGLFDLRIFVDAPEEIRLQRRLTRDVNERGRTEQSVRDQWSKTVHPMYQAVVEPTSDFADLVLHTHHDNDLSTRLLIDGLRSQLDDARG